MPWSSVLSHISHTHQLGVKIEVYTAAMHRDLSWCQIHILLTVQSSNKCRSSGPASINGIDTENVRCGRWGVWSMRRSVTPINEEGTTGHVDVQLLLPCTSLNMALVFGKGCLVYLLDKEKERQDKNPHPCFLI